MLLALALAFLTSVIAIPQPLPIPSDANRNHRDLRYVPFHTRDQADDQPKPPRELAGPRQPSSMTPLAEVVVG
jgi:hypothetical protein